MSITLPKRKSNVRVSGWPRALVLKFGKRPPFQVVLEVLISNKASPVGVAASPLVPTPVGSVVTPQLRVVTIARSEEHTSELQSPCNLVCRLLLEKKKNDYTRRARQRTLPILNGD